MGVVYVDAYLCECVYANSCMCTWRVAIQPAFFSSSDVNLSFRNSIPQ